MEASILPHTLAFIGVVIVIQHPKLLRVYMNLNKHLNCRETTKGPYSTNEKEEENRLQDKKNKKK